MISQQLIPFGIGAGVRRSELPRESLIASCFAGADFTDAYVVALKPGEHRLDDIANSTLGHPGVVFRTAMSLRDTVMSLFGVKTSQQIKDRLIRDGADHLNFFPVLSRSPSEIVLGEDDRHLDFRLSMLLRQTADGTESELIATTMVNYKSVLGRAYLETIMVGHLIVVRSALAKAARMEAGQPRSCPVQRDSTVSLSTYENSSSTLPASPIDEDRSVASRP